jgi:hypothetical protein
MQDFQDNEPSTDEVRIEYTIIQENMLVRGDIFRTRPNRPWGPPSLLTSRYWVSFPGDKAAEGGVNLLPQFSTEVKERVELYLYFFL